MANSCWIIAATGLMLAATPALARHRLHRVEPAPKIQAPYADWSGWQGEAIARETARQQTAPGLTEELAPDAKQTATGGPSGGVPGFGGH